MAKAKKTVVRRTRAKQVHLYLSGAEYKALTLTADHFNMTISSLLRRWIQDKAIR